MELDGNEGARRIVRAVVELGHALELSVCAEGVEREASWRPLQELGCERAQGYHMSRPLAPERLVARARQWGSGQERERAGVAGWKPGTTTVPAARSAVGSSP